MSAEGSSAFALLAEFADALRQVRRDLTRLVRATAAAARSAGAIRDWLRGLPRLTVLLSDRPVGDDIVHGLTVRQPWPFRYRAVATMALPESFDIYLRGRPKQAVRTNRRRASERGFSTRLVTSVEDAGQILDAMLSRHEFHEALEGTLRAQLSTGRPYVWFGYSAQEEPLAIATVIRDGAVAHLASLHIALDVEDRSYLRFLLSTDVIALLIEHGVELLIADSMLLNTPGVVYLQSRLGFVPTDVRVQRVPQAEQLRNRSVDRSGTTSSTSSRMERNGSRPYRR